MRYKVVAISGALQQESKVTNIAKKCALFKTSLEIQLVSIKDIPLINVDLINISFPPSLEYIRNKISNCDGVLFVVPQFFGKVSPAFKNIYDWLSYSPDAEHPSPIRNLPACMISVGGQDGSGVQKHMIQMSQFCRLKLMSRPSLHFNSQKLDSFGKNFQNSAGKDIDQLQTFLEYFSEFIVKKGRNK